MDGMKHNRTKGSPSTRNSSLTFAVIWDPQNGLEAFSSDQLFETPADVSVAGHDFDCWSDDSKSTVQLEVEPFALFGSRQLHFIDIRSSNMFKNLLEKKFGHGSPTISSASSYSDDSWRSSFFLVEKTQLAVPLQPLRGSTTPTSQDSFFLGGPPIWQTYSNSFRKSDTIDDEGFFELSSHADCDPHLPSRFSISDTSTSAYVPVSVPLTPMDFSHRRVAKPKKDRGLRLALKTDAGTLAPSSRKPHKFLGCGSLSPTARLSKLLPPWMRRLRDDEGWVLVEVQPMVVETIVHD